MWQTDYEDFIRSGDAGNKSSFFTFQSMVDNTSIRHGWRQLRTTALSAFCSSAAVAQLPAPVDAFVTLQEALGAMWDAALVLSPIFMTVSDRLSSVGIGMLFNLEKKLGMRVVTDNIVRLLEDGIVNGVLVFGDIRAFDKTETELLKRYGARRQICARNADKPCAILLQSRRRA